MAVAMSVSINRHGDIMAVIISLSTILSRGISFHNYFSCCFFAHFHHIYASGQPVVAYPATHHVIDVDRFAVSAIDDNATSCRIDADRISCFFRLADILCVEEVDMESERVTVLADVGDFKAGLGGAVGKVGMWVGGRTKSRAAGGEAEMGIADATGHRVDIAARSENPL